MNRKPTRKLVVLGDCGVGKTALFHQFVDGTFDASYKATLGADFRSVDVSLNDRTLSVQLWDTAGQERFVSLGTSYYRGADACVLVFDLTAPSSFESLSHWLEEFYLHTGNRSCIVLGNKRDLTDQRLVERRRVEEWCAEMNQQSTAAATDIQFFETSAKDHESVTVALYSLLSDLLPPPNEHTPPALPAPAPEPILLSPSLTRSLSPVPSSAGTSRAAASPCGCG